jgi:deoxyribonuclease V
MHMAERFPDVPDLTNCLCQLLAQVPAGRVATCGDLAEALGNRIAARWVGHYALHHDHGPTCICHRIVRLHGELGGYAGGAMRAKVRRLRGEGVEVRRETIDLERFGFRDFVTDRPLERLREIQTAIQRRIVVRPRRRMPKLVGGVDVAYPQPELGVAAYALVETATGQLVWSTTVRRPVAFPYVSTYLSFREIPILLDLLDKVRAAGRMADVLLVDGSGILHHARVGIASHLGVVASTATVGVTKKLLCGQVNIKEMRPGESRPVWERHPERSEGSPPPRGRILRSAQDDECPRLIGVALRPTAGSLRPIFISPGHRTDVEFSERLVRQLLVGRRLPEPIYWADRLCRRGG